MFIYIVFFSFFLGFLKFWLPFLFQAFFKECHLCVGFAQSSRFEKVYNMNLNIPCSAECVCVCARVDLSVYLSTECSSPLWRLWRHLVGIFTIKIQDHRGHQLKIGCKETDPAIQSICGLIFHLISPYILN